MSNQLSPTKTPAPRSLVHAKEKAQPSTIVVDKCHATQGARATVDDSLHAAEVAPVDTAVVEPARKQWIRAFSPYNKLWRGPASSKGLKKLEKAFNGLLFAEPGTATLDLSECVKTYEPNAVSDDFRNALLNWLSLNAGSTSPALRIEWPSNEATKLSLENLLGPDILRLTERRVVEPATRSPLPTQPSSIRSVEEPPPRQLATRLEIGEAAKSLRHALAALRPHWISNENGARCSLHIAIATMLDCTDGSPCPVTLDLSSIWTSTGLKELPENLSRTLRNWLACRLQGVDAPGLTIAWPDSRAACHELTQLLGPGIAASSPPRADDAAPSAEQAQAIALVHRPPGQAQPRYDLNELTTRNFLTGQRELRPDVPPEQAGWHAAHTAARSLIVHTGTEETGTAVALYQLIESPRSRFLNLAGCTLPRGEEFSKFTLALTKVIDYVKLVDPDGGNHLMVRYPGPLPVMTPAWARSLSMITHIETPLTRLTSAWGWFGDRATRAALEAIDALRKTHNGMGWVCNALEFVFTWPEGSQTVALDFSHCQWADLEKIPEETMRRIRYAVDGPDQRVQTTWPKDREPGLFPAWWRGWERNA